jgi:Domain of unknown function (DUF4129)
MATPPDQPPPGPLSAARTAALAASLVLLLVVVSLAARSGDHDRAVPGSAVATTTGHHIFVWVLLVIGPIVAVLGLGFFLYAQVVRRRDPQLAAARRRARRRLLVIGIIVVAGVIYSVRTGQNPLAFLHVHNPFANLHKGGSDKAHPAPASNSDGFATVDWVIAGLTWLLLVGGAVVAFRRIRTRRAAAATAAARAAADDEPPNLGLERLRTEPDPRRAVIGAYALMDRVMADRALGRRRPEAPLEYLGRMTAAGYARITALGRLTRLYARARFSTHPVDRGMQDEAVDAVEAIAAEDAE